MNKNRILRFIAFVAFGIFIAIVAHGIHYYLKHPGISVLDIPLRFKREYGTGALFILLAVIAGNMFGRK
ncbi:MAG TPA: hypothetical protein VE912_17660 [Bacteroidales bacterium]|nr:hypothetical protein [Bacteroidales bacterium]